MKAEINIKEASSMDAFYLSHMTQLIIQLLKGRNWRPKPVSVAL